MAGIGFGAGAIAAKDRGIAACMAADPAFGTRKAGEKIDLAFVLGGAIRANTTLRANRGASTAGEISEKKPIAISCVRGTTAADAGKAGLSKGAEENQNTRENASKERLTSGTGARAIACAAKIGAALCHPL